MGFRLAEADRHIKRVVGGDRFCGNSWTYNEKPEAFAPNALGGSPASQAAPVNPEALPRVGSLRLQSGGSS